MRVILCKKKAELQAVLKLIATLWKQGEISGECLENSFIATMSCPENNCTYRKSYHSQYRRETNKKQGGQFGRQQYR